MTDKNERAPLNNGREKAKTLLLSCELLVELAQWIRTLTKYWVQRRLEGRKEAMRVLVEAGADVGLADKDGWIPLYGAACNNRE